MEHDEKEEIRSMTVLEGNSHSPVGRVETGKELLKIKEEPILVFDEDDFLNVSSIDGGKDFSDEMLKTKEEEEEEELTTMSVFDQDDIFTGIDGGAGGGGGCLFNSPPKPIEGLRDGGPPPFLKKTFEMVDDPGTDQIISWSDSETSFVLWDPHKFSTDLLPQKFKHNNFSSFVRQLNTYRFKKIDPDRWEFANELFQKGKKHMLKDIKRRTTHTQGMQRKVDEEQQQHPQWAHRRNPMMQSQLEKLRMDRIMLRQEILKLKQQQENTEKHIAVVQERMQRTEWKQQHLVVFMSKAFKNPLFLQLLRLLLQKQEVGTIEMSKKRKLEGMMSSFNEGIVGGNGITQRNQHQEELSTIESEIHSLFSTDESGSPLPCQKGSEISGLNTADYVAENFILWEKLMEDELIFGSEGPREVSRDQSDFFLQEWEELIPKPSGWGSYTKGPTVSVGMEV